MSKGVLLKQNRIPGFADPAEAGQFAERVAAKYRRPALHDAITAGLVPRLQELVTSARGTGQLWPDHVEQFRLLVTAGDRLRPTHVALIVMLLEELTGQDTEILRNWRLAERRRLLKASGTITLGPLRFRPITKPMDVREYRASDPLRIPDLHQPVFP